ncbi:MAG TPA: hypothetical protein VE402_00855 [Candidatus Angelobacter sp.]|nr:hypothetical protein [Candidatus Angelobacter sp.]
MSRRIPAALAVLSLVSLLPVSARADETPAEHRNGSIGFHQAVAPLGVRWWLANQKVGIDIGLGYQSEPSLLYSSEKLKSFAIAAGVPIVLQSWPRVHVLFRPGITYISREVDAATGPPVPFATEKEKTLRIAGEIEGEAFIVDNFSVSASTGIQYESFDPGFGAGKENSIQTVGGNFTAVGFHVYLFH